MRILVVNHRDWLNPKAGGVEEVLYQTTTRWAAWGHEVSLLTSDFTGAASRDLTVDGVRIARCSREETFNWVAPWRVRSQFADADVVVEHISKVACLLPWYTSRPLVCYVHHLFGRTIFGNIPWPVAAYVVAMEKLAMRVYRRGRFIAVSQSTAQDIMDDGVPAGNIQVVYNGIDHEFFRPLLSADKTPYPSVLWVGRVRKTKCVTHVIDAFSRIVRHLPSARLTIIGKGDFEEPLRRMIAAKNLTAAVTMTGYLEKVPVRNHMQRSWVLAYPSPKEGWGLCVTEAAACGTPAVASGVPGLRESVRHEKTGFLVTHGDIGELADRLLLLLTNDALRASLSREALEWARNFSWEKTAAQSLAVLQRAAQEPPRQHP